MCIVQSQRWLAGSYLTARQQAHAVNKLCAERGTDGQRVRLLTASLAQPPMLWLRMLAPHPPHTCNLSRENPDIDHKFINQTSFSFYQHCQW